MLNLERLAQLVSYHMGKLMVDQKRCCKVRSHLSSCSLCQDVCPVQGIAVSFDGVHLNESCKECGLCTAVCPTEAIQLKAPSLRELLDMLNDKAPKKALYIACEKQKPKNFNGVIVPCLGSFSREMILALYCNPNKIEVLYSNDKCEECIIKSGGNQFAIGLQQMEQLLSGNFLPDDGISFVSKLPEEKEINLERRQFFASIFGGLKKIPKVATEEASEIVREGFGEAAELKQGEGTNLPSSYKLQLLQTILSKRELEKSKAIPHRQKPALVETCYLCKACVVLCPQQALSIDAEENQLLHRESQCVGCKLCVDICFYKSLSMEESKIGGLLNNEPQILAKGIKQICSECEGAFNASAQMQSCILCANKKGELW